VLTPHCPPLCCVLLPVFPARPTADVLLKHHWFKDAAEGRLTLGKYTMQPSSCLCKTLFTAWPDLKWTHIVQTKSCLVDLIPDIQCLI